MSDPKAKIKILDPEKIVEIAKGMWVLAEELKTQALEGKSPPPAELAWLYTHCKAIGMDCKSDSGKWEHDIALFTTNLKDTVERQDALIKHCRDVLQLCTFPIDPVNGALAAIKAYEGHKNG